MIAFVRRLARRLLQRTSRRSFACCFDEALERVSPMVLRVRTLERSLQTATDREVPRRHEPRNPRFQRTA